MEANYLDQIAQNILQPFFFFDDLALDDRGLILRSSYLINSLLLSF